MKGGLAVAAAMAVGANALGHRHAHDLFKRGNETEVCVPGCTTIWTTITGEATLVPRTSSHVKPTTTKAKPTTSSTSTSTPTPTPTTPTTTWTPTPTPVAPTSTEVICVVPTPEVHTCPTPGTYTFPATTLTLTESTTVCGVETTAVTPGCYTVGGVTTVVETPCTVTCPVAVETTTAGVVTNVIETTTYVCPSAGTYTIAPITTTVSVETVLVYPVPTSYAPGTYCAPEQVVTVTETDFVYVCPLTQQGLPTTTPAAKAAAVEVVTYEAVPTTSSTPVVVVVESTSSAAKATATAKTSTSSGSLTGSNDHYGITYTPYESSNGNCKSSSEVESDISALASAGFEVIRVYSTDCNTLEYVGGACAKYGLKLIIGVFVKETGCTYDDSDIKEQVDAIAAWAQWDMVDLFVVGNEAIMNGFCTPAELASLITTVKGKCSGYTGPYTISETLNIWQETDVSSAICGVVDVTGANIHAYFNADVTPSEAGSFVSGQLELLADICPGNVVINLECGWPTAGVCNGVACPGTSEQASAIASIRESCGDKTVFFSYEDDMWKDAGDCGCEQSWGLATCFDA